MTKKTLLALCLFILLVFTGCSGKQNGNNSQANTGQEQAPVVARDHMWIGNDNFTAGTADDLTAGSWAMVLGTANSDGSIVARQILLGTSSDAFAAMGRGFMRNGNAGSSTGEGAVSAGDLRPNFDPAQFRDMSEEERARMRENMAARWGGGSVSEEERARMTEQRANGRADGTNFGRTEMTRVNGEIFDLTEGMITLKLDDGGSRLIFYSAATVIMKNRGMGG